MRNLIVLAALVTVGCATAPKSDAPINFGDSAKVGSYTLSVSTALSETQTERIQELASKAQSMPQLAFPVRLYVAGTSKRTANGAAQTAQLSPDSMVIFLEPVFHKQNARDQEAIFTHELVHAKLLFMGLGDKDTCSVTVHEQIAYSVSVKFEKNMDKAQAFRTHIGKLRSFVQTKCNAAEFSRFYTEFGVK